MVRNGALVLTGSDFFDWKDRAELVVERQPGWIRMVLIEGRSAGYVSLNRDEIRKLRDELTEWLDDPPRERTRHATS